LASVVLARRMVAPIRVLQEGAARIGAGELGHRIDVRTGDELETLGEEFNRTAARLEESYATLEQRVESRTRELADANAELNDAFERLKALGEVAQAVNSTLDLETVLNTIAARAVALSGANGGVIHDYDEATQEFSHIRGADGLDDDLRAVLSAAPMRLGEGAAGKAAALRAPVQIADVLSGESYDVESVPPRRAFALRDSDRRLPCCLGTRAPRVLQGSRRAPADLRHPVRPRDPQRSIVSGARGEEQGARSGQ